MACFASAWTATAATTASGSTKTCIVNIIGAPSYTP